MFKEIVEDIFHSLAMPEARYRKRIIINYIHSTDIPNAGADQSRLFGLITEKCWELADYIFLN